MFKYDDVGSLNFHEEVHFLGFYGISRAKIRTVQGIKPLQMQ